jgi:hypothetical protein
VEHHNVVFVQNSTAPPKKWSTFKTSLQIFTFHDDSSIFSPPFIFTGEPGLSLTSTFSISSRNLLCYSNSRLLTGRFLHTHHVEEIWVSVEASLSEINLPSVQFQITSIYNHYVRNVRYLRALSIVRTTYVQWYTNGTTSDHWWNHNDMGRPTSSRIT